jgi:hypothetical protein
MIESFFHLWNLSKVGLDPLLQLFWTSVVLINLCKLYDHLSVWLPTWSQLDLHFAAVPHTHVTRLFYACFSLILVCFASNTKGSRIWRSRCTSSSCTGQHFITNLPRTGWMVSRHCNTALLKLWPSGRICFLFRTSAKFQSWVNFFPFRTFMREMMSSPMQPSDVQNCEQFLCRWEF